MDSTIHTSISPFLHASSLPTIYLKPSIQYHKRIHVTCWPPPLTLPSPFREQYAPSAWSDRWKRPASRQCYKESVPTAFDVPTSSWKGAKQFDYLFRRMRPQFAFQFGERRMRLAWPRSIILGWSRSIELTQELFRFVTHKIRTLVSKTTVALIIQL